MLEARQPKEHFPFLDSIRGVAILMVVAFHAFSFVPASPTQETIKQFLQALSLGVPLFFVLSGFLISRIVFSEGDQFDACRFGIRRFARIYPPFIASLFLYVALIPKSGIPEMTWTVIGNLLTLPNFTTLIRPINPVSWSLFVEIHFYIFFPLLYRLFARMDRARAPLLTLATMLGVSLLFRILAWQEPVETAGERFFLINRFPNSMDYFCWGILYSSFLSKYGVSLNKPPADPPQIPRRSPADPPQIPRRSPVRPSFRTSPQSPASRFSVSASSDLRCC
jgi:peptidoglycan/LPS O-acetylase OafA/YrhL